VADVVTIDHAVDANDSRRTVDVEQFAVWSVEDVEHQRVDDGSVERLAQPGVGDEVRHDRADSLLLGHDVPELRRGRRRGADRSCHRGCQHDDDDDDERRGVDRRQGRHRRHGTAEERLSGNDVTVFALPDSYLDGSKQAEFIDLCLHKNASYLTGILSIYNNRIVKMTMGVAYEDGRTCARVQARLGRRTGGQTGKPTAQIEPKSYP